MCTPIFPKCTFGVIEQCSNDSDIDLHAEYEDEAASNPLLQSHSFHHLSDISLAESKPVEVKSSQVEIYEDEVASNGLLQSPLFYHPRDLSYSESKPVEDKLSQELARAKEQMKIPPLCGFLKFPFEMYAWMPCDFEIESKQLPDLNLDAGVAHAKGRRDEQEDEHIACSGKIETGNASFDYDLFGIIDGHTGDMTAQFVKAHLQKEIEKALIKQDLQCEKEDDKIRRALKDAFLQLDMRIAREVEKSGAVAVISLKIGSSLWTANLGDSRAVLKAGDETIQLSVDAKPDDPRFKRSIEKRGGIVTTEPGDVPRINKRLAPARSFGDKDIKGPEETGGYYVVSPHPKITKVDLSAYQGKRVHLILACDGIWDFATSFDAASIVGNQSPEEAAIAIVKAALNARSDDNCSALVVCFAKDELCTLS
jgi:protein phosphatase 1L